MRGADHGAFYDLIDALELFETWFMKELPPGLSFGNACCYYNRKGSIDGAQIRGLKVDTGYLFVRVE